MGNHGHLSEECEALVEAGESVPTMNLNTVKKLEVQSETNYQERDVQGYVNNFQMIDWTVTARDFEVACWKTQGGHSLTCQEWIISTLQN